MIRERLITVWTAWLQALQTLWQRLWGRKGVEGNRPLASQVASRWPGLSQAEAAARYEPGQSNAIHLHPLQTRRSIIYKNTFTVFNTGLVAIIGVQIMLGKYLDALVSVGVLIFTIGVNVFQEEFARSRLRRVEAAAQPRAMVIREGKVRSTPPDRLVPGDVVEFGPGDQILVDGRLLAGQRIVMDESLIMGRGHQCRKKPGDPVYAGSFCVKGRGILRAHNVGNDRFIVERLKGMIPSEESMTPLEHLMDRVLRWLLIFVLGMAAFLLIRYYHLSTPLPPKAVDKLIDAIGVIFSIAPAGLFFMIALTYATATVDMAKLRVLVQRARTIETLAQMDIVVLSKEGFLTGRWLSIEPVPPPPETTPPTEIQLREMLGTFARSLSHPNQFIRAMQGAFEGSILPPAEEMPFFAHYGWSGIRLEDETMQGVWVLGLPDVLAPHLVGAGPAPATPAASPQNLSERLKNWGRGFRRKPGPAPEPKPTESSTASSSLGDPSPSSSSTEKSFFRWEKFNLVKRAQVLLRERQKGQKSQAGEEKGAESRETTTLLFAWRPEPQPLHNGQGLPHLPEDLIPLCHLHYQEQANPQAVEALHTFTANGVIPKLFDPGPVEAIRLALQEAGAEESFIQQLGGISGHELARLSEDELARAVMAHQLIGKAGGHLMSRTVRALQKQGNLVGVLGGDASALEAMMVSDLAITGISGPSGALNLADIILLGTSPQVVRAMIDKGQRIVNGLLDVLKLYLTQAFYLLLLAPAVMMRLHSFPYRGAQGGLIAVFALSIPALALTLTAQPGRIQTKDLGRPLALFVLPASITLAATGYFLFDRFLARYGEDAYAQIALVHGLVAMGLLLSLLLRPPLVLRWRLIPLKFQYFLPTLVAIISAALFLLTTYIPLAQKFLYIMPLRTLWDYLFVGGVSLAWAAIFGGYLWAIHLSASMLHAKRRRSPVANGS